MPQELDLSNEFMMATVAGDNRVVCCAPPQQAWMDADQWLVFAAWIVRVAQPKASQTFETIRTAVMNT